MEDEVRPSALAEGFPNATTANDNRYKRTGWLTHAMTHATYWLAVDHYDNPERLQAVHDYYARHTNLNRAIGPALMVPPVLLGSSVGNVISFSSDERALIVGTGIGLATYVGERLLTAVARRDDEKLAVTKGERTRGDKTRTALLLGGRAAFAVATASVIGTSFGIFMYGQEIDQNLRLLDRQANAGLYEVYDATTNSARQESQDLTAEIDRLREALLREQAFLDQLRTGDVDPLSIPIVIALDEQIQELGIDIVSLEQDVSKYVNLLQFEGRGEAHSEVMSDGRTVSTSASGLPGRGDYYEELENQQSGVRARVAQLTIERSDLLNVKDEVVSKYDGINIDQSLIDDQVAVIDDTQARIDRAEVDRAETQVTIATAHDVLKSDPSYKDRFSARSVLQALDEIKESNPDSVNQYMNTMKAIVFMLEIANIALLKLGGATNVGARRARKDLVDLAEDIQAAAEAKDTARIAEVSTKANDALLQLIEGQIGSGDLNAEELADAMRTLDQMQKQQSAKRVVSGAPNLSV